jgi:uncharacterized protein (DUF1810 family)
MVDPKDSLARFVDAQAPVWDDVVSELRSGHKSTHWMWFVFPQLASLGRSATAKFYGLRDSQEARAYIEHPVLGPRLVQCCELLSTLQGAQAVDVFGHVDAMKFRSCLTLFAAVAPQHSVFRACLDRFFGGEPDPLTLEQLNG